MISTLKTCPLFFNLTDVEIERFLKESRAETVFYEKNEMIFYQADEPKSLPILLEGNVAICNDTVSGKRNIVAVFHEGGEIFGEVFLFLRKGEYEHYAEAAAPSKVLHIPKAFFNNYNESDYYAKMINNMLTILAQKAYYLNKRLQIMSSSNLRQKIAKMLLLNYSADSKAKLSMSREDLADFLNVARPSLSRELMKMQEDGLVKVSKRDIIIDDLDLLESQL